MFSKTTNIFIANSGDTILLNHVVAKIYRHDQRGTFGHIVRCVKLAAKRTCLYYPPRKLNDRSECQGALFHHSLTPIAMR